ncbi:hypothetical protein L195_g028949, partial [Trifolium pratense]
MSDDLFDTESQSLPKHSSPKPEIPQPVKTYHENHPVQITTIQLKGGSNYFCWSQSVRLYLRWERKNWLHHWRQETTRQGRRRLCDLGCRKFHDHDMWKSTEDCQHYKKMVDVSRVFKFLAGLNIEFDEVRGRILGRNPIPPIGEVFAEVRREESRRQVMLGKKAVIVPPPVEGSALAVPQVN